MSFTCPCCEMTSQDPADETQGYCGNCHEWTGDASPEEIRLARVRRINVHHTKYGLMMRADEVFAVLDGKEVPRWPRSSSPASAG